MQHVKTAALRGAVQPFKGGIAPAQAHNELWSLRAENNLAAPVATGMPGPAPGDVMYSSGASGLPPITSTRVTGPRVMPGTATSCWSRISAGGRRSD
jgi:hypothetical protein